MSVKLSLSEDFDVEFLDHPLLQKPPHLFGVRCLPESTFAVLDTRNLDLMKVETKEQLFRFFEDLRRMP